MPQERQRELISGLPKDNQRVHLDEVLSAAVHHGYTISRGEIFVGAVAVAAPYFDHRGSVIGSVGLYGPSARVSEDKIAQFSRHVRQAGNRISALLGYQEGQSAAPEAKPEDTVPAKRARRAAKA